MTRLDVGPEHTQAATACDGPRALVLDAREVPLGGIRAMSVHRLLPHRELPMVGAWCFLDRFGPQTTVMRVDPHPHLGLQTVTWPLAGEVRHRDSLGSDVLVRRGALNLMTSGAGIAHSEYSAGDEPMPLDALQLWVALPEHRRHGAAAFEQHDDLPVIVLPAHSGRDASAVLVLGELAGIRSPATAHTPIVGAELRIPAGTQVRIPLHPEWEHALVGLDGIADVAASGAAGVLLQRQQLLYLGVGRDRIEVTAAEDATLFLLGGEPFDDEIVMWWNFVARSHDEIVAARDAWQQRSARFGEVAGHGGARIPAPPLPTVRLRPRRRR